MSSDEADRWERPWIKTEEDAIDEAAHRAYEGIMEDPDSLDQEGFEWITQYEAENFRIEDRVADVQKKAQEKASAVVPERYVDTETDQ